MLQITTENKLGSDCSGTDGTANRVLTLANLNLTSNSRFMVFVGGFAMAYNLDYTLTNLPASSQVTFLGIVHDQSPIQVFYFQDIPNPNNYTIIGADPAIENFLGSACTGNDGDSNRTLTIGNDNITTADNFMVFVGGFAMAVNIDYTVNHLTKNSVITFLGAIHDQSPITVIYYQTGSVLIISGTDDFERGPLSGFGVNVIWTPVIRTVGFSGQKTYTDGVDSVINVVFINPTQNFVLDLAGLTEIVPDALIFCSHDILIRKYDKISFNGKIYRAEKVSDRFKRSTLLFRRIDLFFTENE